MCTLNWRLVEEEKVDRVSVNLQIVVTQEDIDDIMVTALEGGINYWCGKAEKEKGLRKFL